MTARSLKVLLPTMILLGFLSAGCQTVPETGRTALNFYSTDQENQLGAESYTEILKDARLSRDRSTNEMLQRVGRRIALVSPYATEWDWEFKLVDSEQINAFALPGGKVAVYTGILPYTKDEDGLAAVIGHEVAHAVARHGGQRLTQMALVQGGEQLVAAALSGQSEAIREVGGQVYGAASAVGAVLPYSRSQESEADHIGMLYMARAGYDPRAAIGLWERMPSGDGLEFMSTHPKNETRIRKLRELLPQAMDEYRQARGGN